MIYAIIEGAMVTNIVVGPLPDAIAGVAIGNYPVAIVDRYEGGIFLRDGSPVLPEEPIV